MAALNCVENTEATRHSAGYDLRLPAAGTLGTHRIVEAMKHAFALRMNLGDPGPDPAAPYVNVTEVLDAMLSLEFAASLRREISLTEMNSCRSTLRHSCAMYGATHEITPCVCRPKCCLCR